MENLEKMLATIAAEIGQAEQHLEQVKERMEDLKLVGMYPAVPTERWKDDRYLYLYFANGADGLKLDAKQRIYIGTDPAKVEEARRMVETRRTWEALQSTAEHLQRWLREREEAIKWEAHRAEAWPKAGARLLGTDIAGQGNGRSPKLGRSIKKLQQVASRPTTYAYEDDDDYDESDTDY